MKRFLNIFLCILLLPAAAIARESDPDLTDAGQKIGDRLKIGARFRAAYVYSDLSGGDSLSGWDMAALLAPYYKVSEDAKFILLYDGKYYRKREFYSDDIGSLERTEYQAHNIAPMLRMDFGPGKRYSVTPSLFYTTTLNKDFEDSDWSDGLYNYNDVGGAADFTAGDMGFNGAEGLLKLGTQVYRREYPNYNSLLDLSSGLNIEPDEKDYLGIAWSIEYDLKQDNGFSWHAEYILLSKMLEDKNTVDAGGVLSGEKQKDFFHTLLFDVGYAFAEGWELGLELNGSLYDSNQNFYDGMETTALNDDVFISNFYDYTAYLIRPRLLYQVSAFPLTITTAYAILQTDYQDRRAKYDNGRYKNDTQSDLLKSFELRLQYSILPSWQIYAIFQNSRNDSNNKDERVYRYSYTVNNYYLGFAFQY